jgi:hypothetical protein
MRNWLVMFVLALALVAGGVHAQSKADRVLAQWEADGMWYPARITEVVGRQIHVVYDDGDIAVVGALQIRTVDWHRGTRVQCNWRNQGQYYAGTIDYMEGERIDVRYDDGDRETMMIGRCRSGTYDVE